MTTTPKQRHTPTPWHISEWVKTRIESEHLIVCNMTGDDKLSAANAAHIVRCVNGWPVLVEVLRSCIKTLEVANIAGRALYGSTVVEAARAALKQAE